MKDNEATRTWQDNAAEFEALNKQGKSLRLAVLVACSVEKGSGGPTVATATVSKVTMRTFAEKAGTDAARISRHLTAWNKLAEQFPGELPTSDELTPADANSIDLDNEQLCAWDNLKLTGGTDKVIAENPSSIARVMADPEVRAKVIERMEPQARQDVAAEVIGQTDDTGHLAATQMAAQGKRELINKRDGRKPVTVEPSSLEGTSAPLLKLMVMDAELKMLVRSMTAAHNENVEFTDTVASLVRDNCPGIIAKAQILLDLVEGRVRGHLTDADFEALLSGGGDK